MLKYVIKFSFFVDEMVVLCPKNIDLQRIMNLIKLLEKPSIIVEYLSQNQYIIGTVMELIYCNKLFYFLFVLKKLLDKLKTK